MLTTLGKSEASHSLVMMPSICQFGLELLCRIYPVHAPESVHTTVTTLCDNCFGDQEVCPYIKLSLQRESTILSSSSSKTVQQVG